MKGISAYVATVIILLTALSIGFFVYIWFYGITTEIGGKVEETGKKEINCQFGSLIVYTETINCSRGFLNFSLKNNGYIDLYDIRVIVSDNNRLYSFLALDRNGSKPITRENALKPLDIRNLYVNVSGISVKFFEVITQCRNVNTGKINILCT